MIKTGILVPDSRWRWVLRRYWMLCKVSFQERMEYRLNILFYTAFNILPALIGIFLWGNVFGKNAGSAFIQGITTYYLVASFVSFRIPQYQWAIMQEVFDGRMASSLLRPISYVAKTFWYEVGGRIWSTIMCLPVYIIIALALGENFRPPADPINWFWAILAFCISYVLSFFITASLGLLSIWQNQPEGFYVLYDICARWLGGVFVPLALMPGVIGQWLQWLPFAYLYNLPIRIFVGMPPDQMLQGFAVQLAWVAIAALCFNWLWRKAINRYEVFER